MDGSINLGDLSGVTTPFLLAASGDSGAVVNASVNLGDLNGQNTPFSLGGSLEPAMPWTAPLQLAASGSAGTVAFGDSVGLTVPTWLLSGGSADGMALLPFQLGAVAESGNYVVGNVALAQFQLTGSLEPALALPTFSLSASGAGGSLLAAQLLSLPLPDVEAAGGDNVVLQPVPFALDAQLLAGTIASANLLPSTWSLGASSFQNTTSTGAISLGLVQVAASASISTVTLGSINLGLAQLNGSAASGNLATAVLSAPLYDLQAQTWQETIGGATLLLPAFTTPGAAIVPFGRAFTTTIALNTRLKGVSRYAGLTANSFTRFAGVELAATSAGIVVLIGDDDLGLPIAAQLVSGSSDLNAPNRKRIESAYVGYRATDEMELTLNTDEHVEYTYRLAPRQWADNLHGTRVKFGRGVDGRYWAWQLANLNGGGFDLVNLQLNVVPLVRVV